MACGRLGTDLDAVIAIEVTLPDSGIVERGDTMIPRARALNGRGDSVATTVYWSALDTLIVQVLDTTTGATLGKKPGSVSGRIQARAGSLRSNPLSVAVRPQADTLFASGTGRDTVTASASADSLSDSLKVQIQDLYVLSDTVRACSKGITPVNLAARPVTFQITYPTGGSGFTLVPQDSVLSGSGGIAVVRVRLVNRTLPDSAVVTATAVRANGLPVPGSGVTFVVEFVP